MVDLTQTPDTHVSEGEKIFERSEPPGERFWRAKRAPGERFWGAKRAPRERAQALQCKTCKTPKKFPLRGTC